ncbi:hypothetical protein BGV52_15525 [Burkholderia ubonensis]|uniref:hypothetical protein n=1 Tax=Burkholderia ubonensis TaxID=101571 RepID=UPI0008FDA42E|nr:hypothetical protein [Burkholderia ubonensis]OJB09097.1 hypothetical protein BGV52_15525 [Burkholderia ubonensis]
MSTIKKALNDLAMTKEADVTIREGYSTIHLEDDGGRSLPIKMRVTHDWFSASDLRKAAKLFKKLAKQLEAEGRTA